jgi:hypothetical protein
MEESKNKNRNILIVAIVAIIIGIFVVVIFLGQKDKVNNIIKPKKSTEIQSNEVVKKVRAKIDSVSFNSIEATTSNGEKLKLNIAPETSIVKQTLKGDGVFSEENMAVLDIPKDKLVDVQYNSQSNELMLLTVR